MPFANVDRQSTVYDRLRKLVFSGDVAPGTKLVERDLAQQLGVSRIPVRESLGKLVAQGMLVGGEKWQGARVRNYTQDELRQLYEYREMLEGGAARAAARAATDADITWLYGVCDQAESEVGHYGSERWAGLDYRFHTALGEASHNERIIHGLRLLLTECFYVFYLHPARKGRPKPSPDVATAHMQSVVEDHRALVELIRGGNADGAEARARADMRKSGDRAMRALIASDLNT